MSQEPLNTEVDQELDAEITEYAKIHDLSTSEATEELLQAGLSSRRQRTSPTEPDPKQAQLEQRQQVLAHQQRQIIRFQKLTVMAGIGWAILTVVTRETGPLWTALGMLIIGLMAASTYIWRYFPSFE